MHIHIGPDELRHHAHLSWYFKKGHFHCEHVAFIKYNNCKRLYLFRLARKPRYPGSACDLVAFGIKEKTFGETRD